VWLEYLLRGAIRACGVYVNSTPDFDSSQLVALRTMIDLRCFIFHTPLIPRVPGLPEAKISLWAKMRFLQGLQVPNFVAEYFLTWSAHLYVVLRSIPVQGIFIGVVVKETRCDVTRLLATRSNRATIDALDSLLVPTQVISTPHPRTALFIAAASLTGDCAFFLAPSLQRVMPTPSYVVR
jgi:hypothetical protein